jgi:trimeric autotransporter adhesin
MPYHPLTPKHIYRSLIIGTLFLGGSSLASLSALAASPTPNTIIDNQATGSFVDDADNSVKPLESNIVIVTVAEVAGITVTGQGTSGAFFPGAVSYFDFTITNVGNDPTQFFIPDGPSEIGGGTQQGNIQIISYDADGSGSGAAVNLTSNNIYVTTAGGATTGSLLNGVVGTSNGSVPPGGTITVRVSVNVTGAVGTNISVTLGDTPVPPNATSQNQSFVLGTKDIYTVDNADPSTLLGEAAGLPINGDSVNHWQEASAKLSTSIVAPPIALSGKVFEDVNYGGGAGRNLSTSAGIVRADVRVELYDSAGAFKGFAITDALGAYTFDSTNIAGGILSGDYKVRVVNSTVTSSRPNPLNVANLMPIQTFRTDASTGTAIADPNRVGGEIPAEVDAPANTGSQTLATINTGSNEAESIAPVKVVSGNVTEIDFGFNFDTIVNINAIGQGSLTQFILNSNALNNTGLAQVGQIAGTETSIFMISDGLVHNGLRVGLSNLLTAYGAAKITSNVPLPNITDAYTSIDGRTQTANIGNTNTTTLGDVTTIVGVGGTPLAGVPGPEIELYGSYSSDNYFLYTTANRTTIRGLAITATSSSSLNLGGSVWVGSGANDALITENAIGVKAANDGSAGTGYIGAVYTEANDVTIDKNLLLGRGTTVYNNNAITGWKITNNEIASSVIGSNSGNATINFSQGSNTAGPQNPLIQHNYLHNGKWGIAADGSSSQGAQILDNTIQNSTKTGILINYTEKNHLIKNNIITGNGSGGVVIEKDVIGVTISQNSIYGNTGPGIDLSSNQANYASQGISSNDGQTGTTGGVVLLGNKGMDYPIITTANLSGSILTLKGFVGNNQNGSATFANATLEFFIADDDGDQNGQVVAGDGKSKPHGEGKTYIGTCSTNANSLFDCSFNNTVTLGMTNPNNITATATDAAGNTSEFGTVWSDPNVLLVKRITAMNGGTTTVNGDDLAIYYDTASPYDDNVSESTPFVGQPNPNQKDTTFWPNPTSFLLGGTNGGKIRPGYEMDYTIYFLSTGNTSARSTELCDRIPPNQDFVHTAFNSATAANGGTIGGDRGILVSTDGVATAHTNLSDGDMARYYEPGEVLPTSCGTGANTNGAILVNLGMLPAATAPGIPTNSNGFVRFRVKMR